ncbi:glycosyltransferase family 1 protein [Methanosarcina hadiensis]|uniref:glycosyltransferase family 4 protein n=1 Tax=Methanosarcina hadiensis TaxID=3078083 RepID=UPI0039776722
MEIDYINGPKTDEIFGMSKYQKEINERIKDIKLNPIEYPKVSKNKEINNAVKYLVYPYIVKKHVKKNNIKHITSQDLAYILKLVKLERTIVTCHDLIPWVYDNNRLPTWKLNMRGLKKADRIITVSEYSKNEIIKYVGYSEDQITVIPNAVDHNNYYVKRNRGIVKKLGISDTEKVILYVGSEQPRKNVPFILEAISVLKKKLPEIKLLKVGTPQVPGAREKLLKLIEVLDIQKEVVFVGYVSEGDLTKYYNAADLFVFPSLYEGFGLPPLEAMACGTPVITSNLTSLPEVVGDSAITIDPYDVNEFAEAMYDLLTDENLRKEMINKGLKRAQLFNWEKSAEETRQVYEMIN